MIDGVQNFEADVVRKKFGSVVTAQTRSTAWDKITKSINAVGAGALRQPKQVELKWRDIKSKALMSLASHKRESQKTGICDMFSVQLFILKCIDVTL